jgi:hypothetical protein
VWIEGQADREDADVPARAAPSLFTAIFVLVAAGIGVILLSASLGAATSGRSLFSSWFGASGVEVARKSIHATADRATDQHRSPRGHHTGSLTQTSEFPEILGRSGA